MALSLSRTHNARITCGKMVIAQDNLDAIDAMMEEIKEWEYLKVINDWNESLEEAA